MSLQLSSSGSGVAGWHLTGRLQVSRVGTHVAGAPAPGAKPHFARPSSRGTHQTHPELCHRAAQQVSAGCLFGVGRGDTFGKPGLFPGKWEASWPSAE